MDKCTLHSVSLQHSLSVSSSSIGPRTPEVLTKPLHQRIYFAMQNTGVKCSTGESECTARVHAHAMKLHSFIHSYMYTYYVIATCKAQLQHCFKLECKLFTVYVAIFFPVPIPLEPCISQHDKAVGDHCCPKYPWHQLSLSLCYKQPSALGSKQYRLNPDVIGQMYYSCINIWRR